MRHQLKPAGELVTVQDLHPKSGSISQSSLLTYRHSSSQPHPRANAPLPRYCQGGCESPPSMGSLPVKRRYSPPTKSFADVPITDAGVDTLAFLQASEGVLGLFGTSVLRFCCVNPLIGCALVVIDDGTYRHADLLGSAAFTPVQADIKGNITVSLEDSFGRRHTCSSTRLAYESQKVRARYDAAPALSATLEQLVENEKGEKKRTATEGLMWLLRGLSFTCKALQNSQADKTQELSAAFGSSYEATLKKFHGLLTRPIFTVSYLASFFSLSLSSLLPSPDRPS